MKQSPDASTPHPAIQHIAIQQIPLGRIRILNPRTRNRKTFAKLVENIATLGLKRPVTVVESGVDEDGKWYQLVCGQGRYEAFKALGESAIPCMIVEASESDRYLISLVENLARRKHSNSDLLEAVRALEERGYSVQQIAKKVGLDPGYIYCILTLLKQGEIRLIAAVENGWLSIDMASTIAKLGDAEVQEAMMLAYQNGTLKGDQLMRIRRLVVTRQKLGRGFGKWRHRGEKTSHKSLLQAYQTEVRRQRMMVKKADVNHQRLAFITTAFRRLIADEHFRTLLRAEGLNDIPKPLCDLIKGESPDGHRAAFV
ncbi:plasmid partitioning protein RepB C-terminal domain-containing protein [Chitinimonas sp. JJ19]|uniref:plasmid partitioning protein RepB C-terminal domain-containing protein n=1 Tax=Chitinimonas sp. JJ19 TaxID=3109352 RepID=UPI003001087F